MLPLCCLFLSVLRVHGIPYYNGSFVASGEFQRTNFKVSGISHPYELSVFEEAYDSIEKRAAFRVTKKGDVMTYIQELRSKRSYLIRTYGGTTTCVKVPNANFTRKQFMTVVSAPDERIYFFLRDLLVLRSYVKVQTRKNDLVRNQPCRIHGIHTNNYTVRGSMTWTFGNLTKRNLKRPPANITGLPLAMTFPRNATLEVPFEAHFTFRDDGYSEQRITKSILNFDYIGTTLRNTLFEIPDGVRCEGNTNSGLPHPVYDNMRVFSYSARVKSSTWKRHHIIHGAIDINRKLHRLDYKPWRSTSSRERTIIFSGREGLVYNISQSRVSSVGNITDVVFDKQMVLHPGFIENISPKTFFVGNSPATLAYKKIAVKGGLPCHVWDIVRFDWPSNGVKTLWEWCFVDMSYFSQPSAATSSHVVSLDIHVLELPPAPSFGLEPAETLSFQFFDFNKKPSALVELDGFDISSCYNATSPERKIELPPAVASKSQRHIGQQTCRRSSSINTQRRCRRIYPILKDLCSNKNAKIANEDVKSPWNTECLRNTRLHRLESSHRLRPPSGLSGLETTVLCRLWFGVAFINVFTFRIDMKYSAACDNSGCDEMIEDVLCQFPLNTAACKDCGVLLHWSASTTDPYQNSHCPKTYIICLRIENQ